MLNSDEQSSRNQRGFSSTDDGLKIKAHNEELTYAHEVPDDAFDIEEAGCVRQPTISTVFGPQANKESASANEITQHASHYAPANKPSGNVHSDVAISLGETTKNVYQMKRQDPEDLCVDKAKVAPRVHAREPK
ncbi:uncharacterized protein EKO05_0004369 [Ascochyta rabiei]|uniref:uncharacterized protein n=1 Tax=Didymella rabiei TaxID=5454 RepID=UPI0021FDDBCE|nr:uncharacterized protein EKO05_0004369 [Ascochyta rabiei]UPX13873.1 hypothetical protein EKO05_0004369 [Ascochyta rabiei]